MSAPPRRLRTSCRSRSLKSAAGFQESNGVSRPRRSSKPTPPTSGWRKLSAAGDRIGDVVKLITSIAETDQSACPQRDHRGRTGPAMPAVDLPVVAQEVKTLAGQTAKSHRRDPGRAHCQHAARHRRIRQREQGDRADDRAHQRDHHVDFLRGRAAGRGDPEHCERRRGPLPAAPSMLPTTSSVSPRALAKTGTTSGHMLKSAQALSEVSIHLKDEVEKFLDSVRAARPWM